MSILEKTFFLIMIIIFSSLFSLSYKEANVSYTSDLVAFIFHSISYLVIVLLGIVIVVGLFRDKFWAVKAEFLCLGMILASTFVSMYGYIFTTHNINFSVIEGVILAGSLLFALHLFKYYSYNFHIKLILLSIGILLNFLLDIILSYYLYNLWAAFVIILFILGISSYYSLILINNKDKLHIKDNQQ